MVDEEQLTGIVLYTTQLGEYDKRLVILTKERGKITVFANGARRANSSYRAASQSYVMGKFTVRPSRDAYNLVKVEIQDYFQGISEDMERMCYAAYFGELMSYYTREGDSCVPNLNLLYVALKALIAGKMPYPLIRAVYELKLMDIEGQAIHAYSCVKCNEKENLSFFNAAAGGILCGNCADMNNDYKVTGTLIYALQYILSSPLNKLFSFTLDEGCMKEISHVAEHFVGRYTEKNFKSLEILSGLA